MNDMLGEFARTLDRFMARVDPRQIDREHRIPPQLLAGLAELGAFGVTLPTDHGGSELGLTGACRVVDTLARHDRAIATTVGLHLGLGTRGLVAFGTPTQRERYLPRLATGQTLAAFATTEPSSGSDLTRLSTRATRLDPHRMRVSGEKIYVTNGGLAEVFTLTATADGFANVSTGARVLLVAERSDPGLTVGREEEKLGLRGSSTTSLYLDLDLPQDRLLDPPEKNTDPLSHILAWGRTAMAAGCCGTAHAALAKTLDHVTTRTQFGRTLHSQPIVQDQLTWMNARLSAMRALVAQAAAAADTDSPALEPLSLAAKVFASDGDWQICDLAVQLHGGSGYIEDTGVALLLRDARITRIFEGANDVLLTRLGQLELTRPMLASGPAAAPLAELRPLGLKVLRDPRRLHRAGRLAMLGLAHAASAASPTPDQDALAQLEHELAVLAWSAHLEDTRAAPPGSPTSPTPSTPLPHGAQA